MTLSTTHRFDSIALEALSRRPGIKWTLFPEGVLPLWVAEMDFPLAGAIEQAIVEHARGGDLGYPAPTGLPGLREAVARRLAEKHGLATEPDHVMPMSSTATGLALSVRAFSEPGDEVLLLTPLYPPFKKSVELAGRVAVEVELVDDGSGYAIDFAALEAAVTPRTRMLMLCNPHNPVGRVFTREELERLAALAERHDLALVSDDLHADLVLDGRHLPIAALSPEVAARTVTLYGPTKAFNVPGLKVSFAVAQDPERLERMAAAGGGLTTPPNVLAQRATIAAYGAAEAWLDEVLDYLRGNREHLLKRVAQAMPRVKVHRPEGTYLAWLDLRAFDLGEDVAAALAERAQVGVNDGASFGACGRGFARLNFATSRPILDEALSRLERVLG